jgi:hypothetical protein
MKACLLSFIILLLNFSAEAIPVMDTAVGTKTPIMTTVLPDDKNPNLYYFFPNHYGISHSDKTNKPEFFYMERKTGWFTSEGFVNTLFEAYSSPAQKRKFDEIIKANPAAVFTPIPLSGGRPVPTQDFNVLLTNIQCFEKGNMIGQKIGCKWDVDNESRLAFRRMVRSDIAVQVLEYNYSFSAMYNGKFMPFNFSAAVYFSDMGNVEFYDSDGRIIRD